MFCNKVFKSGEIRRFKYHIFGLFGRRYATYPKARNEIKHVMKLNIKSGEILKKNIAIRKL